MTSNTIFCFACLLVIFMSSICTTQGFSMNEMKFNRHMSQDASKRWSRTTTTTTSTRRRHHNTLSMYLPPQSPMTQTPAMVAQSILSTKNSSPQSKPKVKKLDTARGQGAMGPLSNSVLANCDTLPSFPTAHGLLSPETVMRLSQKQVATKPNKAVEAFLDTYRTDGPMSCLPMLADPQVLPHLTEAMRDITA